MRYTNYNELMKEAFRIAKERGVRQQDELNAIIYEVFSADNDEAYLKPALEYMKKRQLMEPISTRFGIGYADGFNDLPEYLGGLGYTNEEMLAVGVAKQKDGKLYDPVANRLIFPIIDIYGNVIAFGGRTLEANPSFAKYLNTAETELFNKRNTLYALLLFGKTQRMDRTSGAKCIHNPYVRQNCRIL